MRAQTLLFLILAPLLCGMSDTPPPPGLDLALARPTDQKMYVVTVRSLADPIVINQMHSWDIKVSAPSGGAIAKAQIEVDGGMPQHGHGFPTQPQVTQELGEGHYLLDGMKFSMSGWWVIKLKIRSALGVDAVTFNVVISLPKT